MPADRTPDRFYSLDALRGLAALSVVFWHWRHFFPRDIFQPERQPMYEVFRLLYTSGWRAVDLFFVLSGFIFYWLYGARIASGEVKAREFFLLRFSRLYPLHLATLLFVAVAQAVAWQSSGGFFVYRHNDGYHFVLNLLFASAIGLESGTSFNAPVWSVSVEVLLYTLFFAACRLTPPRRLVSLLGIAAGLAIWETYPPLTRGLICFFVGGLVYLTYRWAMTRRLAAPVAVLAAACWLVTLGYVYGEPMQVHYVLRNLWSWFVLLPITVLALALAEGARGTLGRRLAPLGDISYSSYLIHFPLQLVFVGAAALMGASRDAFYSGGMMALFFVALIALSFASFHYLERPAQTWLRRRAALRLAAASS